MARVLELCSTLGFLSTLPQDVFLALELPLVL